jgi:hypothetical protein
MRLKDLLRILILNSLFTNVINLISMYMPGAGVNQSRQKVILYGIAVFCLQTFLIFILTKPYREQLVKRRIFRFRFLAIGIIAAIATWLLTQLWTYYATGSNIDIPEAFRLQIYLLTFLLNSIPAALLEEFLFRHLPLYYAESKGFSSQQLVLLAIVISLIFSISHVSAYVVRDQIPFTALGSPLMSAFFYGLAYFLIYAVTRNIYFVTFIHAFSNTPLYLIDSPYRETFYFYSYIFITIIWLIVKEIRKKIIWNRKLRERNSN